YFNSAILLKGAKASQIYKKIHLVPFGEYFPLRKYLFFLEPIVPIGDFNCGNKFVVFNIDNKLGELVSFGVLICFEDTIAELSREFVLKGADFLVNITNDAWFKETSSPYQHLQASVLRAVENRVYLLRAANTGVTCIIDNRGRVIKRMKDIKGRDIFVKGFITGQVNKYCNQQIQKGADSVLTFYTKFADWFILLCILFTAWFSVHFLMKKNR
ncbi:MAG: apolipoprotein N-acyltransferase, partial [Candidatus Omnitrophica bacterium]|nr:apolipoprotein N-acyltransferase [Candidatus Omnitrophota bacterium]